MLGAWPSVWKVAMAAVSLTSCPYSHGLSLQGYHLLEGSGQSQANAGTLPVSFRAVH